MIAGSLVDDAVHIAAVRVLVVCDVRHRLTSLALLNVIVPKLWPWTAKICARFGHGKQLVVIWLDSGPRVLVAIQEVLKEHTEEDLPTIGGRMTPGEIFKKSEKRRNKTSTADGVNGTAGLGEETGKGCQSLT